MTIGSLISGAFRAGTPIVFLEVETDRLYDTSGDLPTARDVSFADVTSIFSSESDSSEFFSLSLRSSLSDIELSD